MTPDLTIEQWQLIAAACLVLLAVLYCAPEDDR